MSNYSSSSLPCGDIWTVNEITSLIALPALQRRSALLLLGEYCSFPECTPPNTCGATVSWGFHRGKDCSGAVLRFPVAFWGQDSLVLLACTSVHWAPGCLRLKGRRCHWPSRGRLWPGGGWVITGRQVLIYLFASLFSLGGSVSIYCIPWRFDISIRCYRQ